MLAGKEESSAWQRGECHENVKTESTCSLRFLACLGETGETRARWLRRRDSFAAGLLDGCGGMPQNGVAFDEARSLVFTKERKCILDGCVCAVLVF